MIYPQCGTKREILPFTVSQSDPASQIMDAWNAKPPGEDWVFAPDSDGSFSFDIDITSKSSQAWIKLEKNISIDVKTTSIANQTATAMKFKPACGGGQNIIEFSPFDLQTSYAEYVTKTSSNQFDFFTFQPGEFGSFHIPFQCKATGYYDITAQIEYQYENEDGIIQIPFAKVSCPQKFTTLTIDNYTNTIINFETIEWSNGHYETVP